MANAVNVNFRMDPTSSGAWRVCAEMGLSMTTAFTIFAKKCRASIGFPLKSPPIPSIPKATSTISVKSSMILTPAKPSSPNMNCSRWTDEAAVEEEAWEDYCLWQTRDKKLLKRINSLIKDIQRNTYEGIGKPEPLKGDLSGWWSRRIDDTHRIVYREQDGNIIIASCYGHYTDT